MGLLRPRLVRKPLYPKLRAPWLVLPWGLNISSQMKGDVLFIAIPAVVGSTASGSAVQPKTFLQT